MRSLRDCFLRHGLMIVLLWGGFGREVRAVETSRYDLAGAAQVDGKGVYLSQIVTTPAAVALPEIRLAPAPPVGQTLVLNRAQIQQILRQNGIDVAATNWSGANGARITRRSRPFNETELKELLLVTLQQERVRDEGQLELTLSRSWPTINVPTEPLSLKILNLPTSGICPMFVAQFELYADQESLGKWSIMVQAKIWREVWVARANLQRGQPLAETDLTRERRNILGMREPPAEFDKAEEHELTESLPVGAPLLARSFRLKPIVHRGQSVEALIEDGVLKIALKVEVLEDGVTGQLIRLRNLQSRRELRGKVQNDKTILISL